MSDIKRSCPSCESWTSSVGIAFQNDEPCPYCGLPAAAAHAIEGYALADERARKAEAEAGRLRRQLDAVREALGDE